MTVGVPSGGEGWAFPSFGADALGEGRIGTDSVVNAVRLRGVSTTAML